MQPLPEWIWYWYTLVGCAEAGEGSESWVEPIGEVLRGLRGVSTGGNVAVPAVRADVFHRVAKKEAGVWPCAR